MDQQDFPQDTPQDAPPPEPQPVTAPEPVPVAEPYQPVPEPAPAVLPTSTLATVSLVAGILGFTFMPLLGTVVALITGYSARNETRSVPPRASGDGMATAGIIMGWIQVALAVVGFCCFVGVLVLSALLASSSRGSY